MKGEEGLKIGLTALEEVPDEERQYPRHDEKDDDEHIGQRRREIGGQLAAEDGENVAHCGSGRGGCWGRLGRSGRDFAKNVVEPAALHLQATDRPAALARELGDFTDNRTPVARENDDAVAGAAANRLDRRHTRQGRQFGPKIPIGAAGYGKAYRVVVARTLREFDRRAIGEDS